MDLQEFKTIIFEAGIVGAGGAGFPTHLKLNSSIDTVILNCAECEPLFDVDKQLLAKYTDEILNTLSILVDVLSADHGIVAVKSSYKETIKAVEQCLGKYTCLGMKLLPDMYPAGDEVIAVYETTGRIVPEGSIPAAVGVVVINVETAFNIYNAIFHKSPVTYKNVTITGEVQKPVTLRVPIGTSVKELLAFAGGAKIDEFEILMGGPMTGKIGSLNSNITKISKCIIVLPKDHHVIIRRQVDPSISLKRAMSVCSQCQMCTDLCPRNLLGHSIKPHKVMNAVANGTAWDIESFTMTMLCCECGLCEMYSCHQSLLPRAIIKDIKDRLKKRGVRNPHNKAPKDPNAMRGYRLVPMERLIERLDIKKYAKEAPFVEDSIMPHRVVINLSQHIGVPASPVVKLLDSVSKGQLIAKAAIDKPSANIHSSIDGIVTHIDKDSITIQRRGEA